MGDVPAPHPCASTFTDPFLNQTLCSIWLLHTGRRDSQTRAIVTRTDTEGEGMQSTKNTHVTKSLLLSILASTWTCNHKNRLLYGHAAQVYVRLLVVWYLRRKDNPLSPSCADRSKPASLEGFALCEHSGVPQSVSRLSVAQQHPEMPLASAGAGH